MRNASTDGRWRCLLAALILWSAPAGAAEPGPTAMDARAADAAIPTAETVVACDADTTERLRFLEDRLEEGRRYARYWWGGWTGFYGLGTIVTSVQAATENDSGERANDVVSAVKAAFGTARLLYAPPNAKNGADAMRAIPADSPAGCAERLARGEGLLRQNADEARSRWSWKRHLSVVGINLAGALIVTQAFDEPRGWTSAGIGVGVGEAMIWSHPWGDDSDLAEYERRFAADGMPAPRRVTWGIAPQLGGAALHVAF
jgi:hypothetical protein